MLGDPEGKDLQNELSIQVTTSFITINIVFHQSFYDEKYRTSKNYTDLINYQNTQHRPRLRRFTQIFMSHRKCFFFAESYDFRFPFAAD